eukprot:gene3033-3493_t
MNLRNVPFYAALLLISIAICRGEEDPTKKSTIGEAGQTIQKLLNEKIGKKIVEAAKEVKGILSKSLGSHVKAATTKLLIDKAVQSMQKEVPGTQNNGVATVGTDNSVAECIKNCKSKAKQKNAKPHIHHVKSMHKGAPGHNTPHNKGSRNRKNMPLGPQPPPQQANPQLQPPSPAAPTMPQTPSQLTCPTPCPTACAPACTQDCCRPMLMVQLPAAAPPPYYPPASPPAAPMCAPPCTQPSCAPTCPPACCAPPPPAPPPATCPGVCVEHCYAICPRGCCRMDIPRKKHLIARKSKAHKKTHRRRHHESASDASDETNSIISNRKSGSDESRPMERNKIPRKKVTTYNAKVV